VDVETPDPRRALAERLMTGLRLSEGVDASAMLEQAAGLGDTERAALGAVIERYAASGHLDREAASRGRWILTRPGVLIADGIASDAMAAVL